MSRAAIILRQEDDSDQLQVNVEFDPPLINDVEAGHPLTHLAAITGLMAIKEKLGSDGSDT